MRKFFALTALCLSMPLAALAEEPRTPKTLVKVNGSPITELHFELFRGEAERGKAQTSPQARMALMNQLVNIAILADAARTEALADRPEVTAALEVAQMKVLAQAALNNYLQNNPVTDAEIEAAYQAKYAQPGYEYKARHILVPTEDGAKELIAQLEAGTDFVELAKAHSTGPSGKNGGDLGWFAREQMVAPFSEATAALEKNAITTEPVQTQFGWHVIRLDDKRENPRPNLDDVKPDLTTALQRERAAAYMRTVREHVNVEVQPAPQAQRSDGAAAN